MGFKLDKVRKKLSRNERQQEIVKQTKKPPWGCLFKKKTTGVTNMSRLEDISDPTGEPPEEINNTDSVFGRRDRIRRDDKTHIRNQNNQENVSRTCKMAGMNTCSETTKTRKHKFATTKENKTKWNVFTNWEQWEAQSIKQD